MIKGVYIARRELKTHDGDSYGNQMRRLCLKVEEERALERGYGRPSFSIRQCPTTISNLLSLQTVNNPPTNPCYKNAGSRLCLFIYFIYFTTRKSQKTKERCLGET